MANTESPSSPRVAGGKMPQDERAGRAAWVERSVGRWHWRIRSDWATFFESCSCPNWLDLPHDPRARLIKTNDLRDIFRVETDHGAVFTKIARPATRQDRLRRLFLGPDSLREWRAAEYARQHKIAAVAPVAAAWASFKGREPASIFISVETPGARPLDDHWHEEHRRKSPSITERTQLLDTVAELIARAHHGGFVHTDLHPGNILISRPPDGGFAARFVDLQAISVGRTVGEKRSIRNLASLGHGFRTNTSASDRLRFFDLYLAWRERLQPGLSMVRDRRRLLQHLDLAAQAHAEAQAAKRDRQALRNGRRFGILRLDRDTTAHVFLWARQAAPNSAVPKTPLTRQWWRKLLASQMDSLWDVYDITHKGTGEHLRTWFNLELEDGKSIAVVSLRGRPTLARQLKSILFSSEEMHLWKNGNALLNRGIPAARPLAVCEKRFCGLLRNALVLIENPRGVEPPYDFMDKQMKELPPRKRYRAKVSIAHQVAMLFRKLDQEGFVYDHLQVSDLAICKSLDSDETPIVVLSGCQGLRRASSRIPLANLQALRQLSKGLQAAAEVSRTDRLRVLKGYLDRLGRPVRDWRQMWREMK